MYRKWCWHLLIPLLESGLNFDNDVAASCRYCSSTLNQFNPTKRFKSFIISLCLSLLGLFIIIINWLPMRLGRRSFNMLLSGGSHWVGLVGFLGDFCCYCSRGLFKKECISMHCILNNDVRTDKLTKESHWHDYR